MAYEYISTDPENKRIIDTGANCDSCLAASSGACEAYQAYRAVTILGESALLDHLTPGLRSAGKHVSIAMKDCTGEEQADQFIRRDSMDHNGIASEVYGIFETASRIYKDTGYARAFPEPRTLQWVLDIQKRKRPSGLNASKHGISDMASRQAV